MQGNTILKEITQTFISKIQEEEIIKDGDVLEKFSALLDDHNIPTVEQLKQALFNEELS